MADTTTITATDYEGYKSGLRVLFQNDPRFKDFDFEGSGLSAILKLLASNSSTQAANSHLVLGESHVSTSQILGNVQALVTATSGYVPDSPHSSYVYGTIEVTPTDPQTAPATITMPVTATFLGVSDGVSYTFTPQDAANADLVDGVYRFENIKLVEGERVVNTFVQSGTSIQQYVIANKSIDIESLSVTVRDSLSSYTTNVFERFHSSFQLGSESSLFFVSMNRKGQYLIEFGDGSFSKSLIDGNIIYASYISTSGSAANGVSSLTPTSEIGGFGNVSITIDAASRNGSDAEDIESIQKRSAIGYGMDGVAVATEEYGQKLKSLYPAHEITQWGGDEHVPQKPGFVILCVYPDLTDNEKIEGVNYLKKYSVGSILTQIVDSQSFYLYLDIFVGTSTTDSTKLQRIIAGIHTEVAAIADDYDKFNITFEPYSIETRLKSVSLLIDRVYMDYTMGAESFSNKRSVEFHFHREVEPGTFTVSVSGSPDFDRISDVNGSFYTLKNGRQVTELKFIGDYSTGDIEFELEKDVISAVEFGIGTISPGGEDRQVSTLRNEIMKISLNSVKEG